MDQSTNTLKPWDQQPNEPALWFNRFWLYCQMGSKRSVAAVYRAEARHKKAVKRVQKSTRNSVSGAWWEASKQWQWESRATAWDADQRAQMSAAYERRKEEILSSGFALNFNRIEALNELAELLLKELKQHDRRWLPDVKSVGSGENAERVDIVRFNSGIIEQFRDTLEDISAEMGERVRGLKLSGTVTTATVSADEMAQARDAAADWRKKTFNPTPTHGTSETKPDNEK